MIRAFSPSVIRIKYLTKKSVLQAEYLNPRSSSGRISHYWRTRKQDNESPLASQLLFLNSCTDLHMESIFPWASIKQHSIIFFFFTSSIKSDYTSWCLFIHDIEREWPCDRVKDAALWEHFVAESSTYCICLKKTNNFYTVSSLHLCPLKLEVTHFSLFFSQTSRAPHIQPYHSQIQLASILGFNFLPEPWKYLTDFIFTTSSSLIKQGKITLIETTFDWSDISTL